MPTVTSVGTVALNININSIAYPGVIAVPVYTIMRNSDVPAQGDMTNIVVACEGEFGGESQS